MKITLTEAQIRNLLRTKLNENQVDEWGKTNRHGIQVSSGEIKKNRMTNRPEFILGLTWIFNDITRPTILSKLNDIAPDVFVARDSVNDKQGILLIIKDTDKLDEFQTQCLPKIQELFLNTRRYKEESINALSDKIHDLIETIPNEQDIENQNSAIVKNWQEILKKLNDPEVRKKLLMFSLRNANRKYGNVLSHANVLMILSQNPNASFVTDATTWRDKYKRKIKAGATPIIYRKPTNSSYSKAALDKAAQTMGFDDADDLKDKTSNSQQTNFAMRAQANKQNYYTRKDFYAVKGYDVLDTELMDFNDDPWTNEVGLLNNLNGSLNAKASDLDAQLGNKPDEIQAGIPNEKLEDAKKRIVYLCAKNGIKINENGTPEQVITDGVYQFAYKKAKEYNVLSDDNGYKFATLVTASICAMYDIKSDIFAKLENKPITQREVLTCQGVVAEVSNCFSRLIAEGKDILSSPEAFLSFVKNDLKMKVIEGPLEEAKRYFSLFERMNNIGK